MARSPKTDSALEQVLTVTSAPGFDGRYMPDLALVLAAGFAPFMSLLLDPGSHPRAVLVAAAEMRKRLRGRAQRGLDLSKEHLPTSAQVEA